MISPSQTKPTGMTRVVSVFSSSVMPPSRPKIKKVRTANRRKPAIDFQFNLGKRSGIESGVDLAGGKFIAEDFFCCQLPMVWYLAESAGPLEIQCAGNYNLDVILFGRSCFTSLCLKNHVKPSFIVFRPLVKASRIEP